MTNYDPIKSLIWGTIGYALRGKGADAVAAAVLGPVVEKAIGITLEDIGTAYALAQEEKARRQQQENFRAACQQLARDLEKQTSPPGKVVNTPPERVQDLKWLSVITHPAVVLILGKRGSGKSALGYRLLELLRYSLSPYVVAVPQEARKQLPDWMGIAESLEDVPFGSIALIDEAYLPYHSRSSASTAAREMSRILNLSRQREQTLIFVTQEARQVDRNITSSANVVVFKDLGMLQPRFERRELNELTTQAREAFTTVKGQRQKWSYVYAPDQDFQGLVESDLPSFWSPKLSKAFATGTVPATSRLTTKIPRDQKIKKAREMRDQEHSYGDIARMLGVTKGTAFNYINGYPYSADINGRKATE